jgi:putative ABC transport system permease protein
MMEDLRLAMRSVVRVRGFSAVVILTLALGMGVNAAIFSIVDTLVLRPLPLADADELVSFVGYDVRNGAGSLYTSYADFVDYQRGASGFERIEGYNPGTWVLSGDDRVPRQLDMAQATNGFFAALGVSPILGRTFSAEEHAGPPGTVVLSHSFWREEMGGDPDILGRTLTLSARTMTVIGVMPEGFDYPYLREMAGWVPLAHGEFDPNAQGTGAFAERDWNRLVVFGRLAEGASLETAQSELEGIATGIAEAFPRSNANLSMSLRSLKDVEVGNLRAPLLLLMGSVSLILLIATVNTANLLLARGMARSGEVAVRTALGAGRGRLVRLFLTEALLYSALGALVGLVLAQGLLAIVRALGADTPLVASVALDGRILGVLALVTVTVGLLFGAAPALQGSLLDLQAALKDGGRRGAGGSRSGGRIQRAFVAVEMALATVLVVGAGLLASSFNTLSRQDPGFEPERISSVRISLPSTYMSDPDDTWSGSNQFFDELLASARRIPGVDAATLSYTNPLEPTTAFNTRYFVPGFLEPDRAEQPFTHLQSITPDFFATFGIPLLDGRLLTDRDRKDAPGVVLINQTMARQAFGDESPIGHRIAGPDFWSPSGYPASWEVVGVVGDVRGRGLDQDPAPAMYLPFAQAPMGNMRLIAQSSRPPGDLAADLRRTVWGMDAAIPMEEIHTMDEYISASVRTPRLAMWSMAGFALLALALAAIGVYGVLSYAVGLRAGEFGIRQVLGADRGSILRLVLRQGFVLAALGVGSGVVLSLFAGRLLESQLFGISATHPPTLIGVTLVLSLVAALACALPAVRATAVEPVDTLRTD